MEKRVFFFLFLKQTHLHRKKITSLGSRYFLLELVFLFIYHSYSQASALKLKGKTPNNYSNNLQSAQQILPNILTHTHALFYLPGFMLALILHHRGHQMLIMAKCVEVVCKDDKCYASKVKKINPHASHFEVSIKVFPPVAECHPCMSYQGLRKTADVCFNNNNVEISSNQLLEF